MADNASEAYVELFACSRENRGRTVRVILGLELIGRADLPQARAAVGIDADAGTTGVAHKGGQGDGLAAREPTIS